MVAVVEDGDFAAVVAEGEWEAVQAMRAAQTGPFERPGPALPAAAGVEALLEAPLREIPVGRSPAGSQDPVVRLAARYSRPWLSHGSIGPSCAVAWAREGGLTLWSYSQGVFDMKRAIAELTGLTPEKVRVIFTPGAGCYGQNGADDVTAEAALIAMALPGRPVRLQWMRAQEFGWEPCGVAGVTEVEAGLDAHSRVTGWRYRVWSNPHDARATGAGGFVAAQQIAKCFPAPVLEPLPMPAGGGDRNADPIYDFAGMDIRYEFAAAPLERGSAMRSLGGQLNVLSIESMLDELALAAGADPLEVRLANLPDPRGIAVLRRAAAAFGWEGRQRGDGYSGAGLGFARYKNQGAYCAVALEITVDRDSGRIRVGRVVAAADAGQIASPDGVRNQIEGGVIQSLSWAMLEQVAMDPRQRISLDWGRYPILRFDQVPERLDVHLLDQPGAAFLGVAEAAQGPATAALANALADATGLRLRDLPALAAQAPRRPARPGSLNPQPCRAGRTLAAAAPLPGGSAGASCLLLGRRRNPRPLLSGRSADGRGPAAVAWTRWPETGLPGRSDRRAESLRLQAPGAGSSRNGGLLWGALHVGIARSAARSTRKALPSPRGR
ncbi:molybdopterin cofactor-binding domain-containing protein [Poseidonocella sp. HB161398]|uniref:molybdopterin cofactor-binding domain-containing protein n=1 Tax=Poseidonocella sp. HB161398 TaxID=2320855 RepID=UPI001108714A|nr:molybdopterin cofactor-binding domain-containing protein [Poseidonocella sp. HB161398]